VGNRQNGERGKKMIEIARIFTFGCSNNRDIVRRLMDSSAFFKGLTFADAACAFKYAERNNLVDRRDGYLVVYHDTKL